jgi:hypothetical protein
MKEIKNIIKENKTITKKIKKEMKENKKENEKYFEMIKTQEKEMNERKNKKTKIEEFLKNSQLTETEKEIINNKNIDNNFFIVLTKVLDIQTNCTEILRRGIINKK